MNEYRNVLLNVSNVFDVNLDAVKQHQSSCKDAVKHPELVNV